MHHIGVKLYRWLWWDVEVAILLTPNRLMQKEKFLSKNLELSLSLKNKPICFRAVSFDTNLSLGMDTTLILRGRGTPCCLWG